MFNYKFDDLIDPALQAFHVLGGSASVDELEEAVAENLKLSDNEIHRGSITKLKYRLAWARTYMKNYGLVENSSRGVWALTTKGTKCEKVDGKDVVRKVKELEKNKNIKAQDHIEEAEVLSELTWQEELLDVVKSMPPASFENLCKRLLRESGFINVEVTGGSGDGGIDGKGVVRIGGLLSFHVVFQAKRYKGTVSSSVIRDFRGAMIGRGDKGLIITTGTFTRDAKTEAQRDGTTPIDLVDGEDLVKRLKVLSIGVKTKKEIIETVEIDKEWFFDI